MMNMRESLNLGLPSFKVVNVALRTYLDVRIFAAADPIKIDL
jgi:hypothetical protein